MHYKIENTESTISTTKPSSFHVEHGVNIPAIRRIEIFEPAEWEEFVEEWMHSLHPGFFTVKRLAGAGDQGIDIAGFCDNKYFQEEWDLFQCKNYQDKLVPTDIWIELGKVIYHTFHDGIKPPRNYFMMSPKGIGLKLQKLLLKPNELKRQLEENWEKYCKDKIETGNSIELSGDFAKYFEAFDFTIFQSKSAADLVKEHAATPFHATRFGGGLPPVSTTVVVPDEIQSLETRYIAQLLEAYSDHNKSPLNKLEDIEAHSEYHAHFKRTRESFYSSEVLRNFARDNVPPGTFELLQNDIYDGVIDTCEMNYPDGLTRMRSTVSKASDLPITNSPLSTATTPKNKNGICHQLANEDRLNWVKRK